MKIRKQGVKSAFFDHFNGLRGKIACRKRKILAAIREPLTVACEGSLETGKGSYWLPWICHLGELAEKFGGETYVGHFALNVAKSADQKCFALSESRRDLFLLIIDRSLSDEHQMYVLCVS